MVKMVQESFEILTPLDGEDILKRIEEAGRTCYQSSHKVGRYCKKCNEPVSRHSDDDEEYYCSECGNSTLDLGLLTIPSSHVFVQNILKRGHESVLEHVSITVRFITNRGCTHEFVRHRLAAYSQESTRFCDYCKDTFGNEITVIDQRDYIINHILEPGHILSDYLKTVREHVGVDCKQCQKTIHAVADWTMAMACAEDSYKKLRDQGLPPEIARGVLPNDLKTDIVCTMNLREWRHVFKLRTAEAAHFNIRGLMRKLCEQFKKEIPIIFDDIKW